MKVQTLLGVVLVCFTKFTLGNFSSACQGQQSSSLQPNPDDCHKFFICMNEIAIDVDCPDDQKFDSSAETCVPSTSPDCQVEELIPEGIECPEKTEDTIFIAYPNNCEKFLKCYSGRLSVFNCPKGLHWDQYYERCEWPGIAQCVPDDRIPTVAPGECDPFENPYYATTFPHPTNCEIFYKCQNGFKLEVPCPYGEHYSVTTKRCEYPAVAKCATLNPGSTSIPNGCPRDDDPYNPTHLLHPTDCTKFYKCESLNRKLMSCPSGQHWNDAMKYCDFPENAKCQTNIPPVVTPNLICLSNDDELLALPGYCSQYIQCSGGLVYVRSCAPGLFWNDVDKTCDNNINSECLVEEGTQLPEFITSTFMPADVPNCSLGMYHSNSNDCSKFYQCSNGEAYLMSCPPALLWNAEQQVCDWPNNVHCPVEETTASSTQESTAEETSIVTGTLTPFEIETTTPMTEESIPTKTASTSIEAATSSSIAVETTVGTEQSIATETAPPTSSDTEETTAEEVATTTIVEESIPTSTTEILLSTTVARFPILLTSTNPVSLN